MTKIFADPPANAPDPANAAEFDFDTFVHALEAAIDSNVKVINMSNYLS